MSFISMRLMDYQKKPELLDEFFELASNHKNMCEEIWLSSDYGFPAIETHKSSAEKMKVIAKRLRENGFKASLQISNTIGHGDFNQHLDYSGIKWQYMVGHDGSVSKYCNCPRDPAFLDYIKEMTMIYADWQPDVVWVDDDLRMNHHRPVDWGCFCGRCIHDFSELYGREWTREELIKAINDPNDLIWRERWVSFGTKSLCNIINIISKEVLSVSPNSYIGIQSGGADWAVYSGRNYLANIADKIQKASGKKMLYRPGGGYYSDRSPFGMIDKAFTIDLSVSCLTEKVSDFRPEIETFPHTAMNKTPRGLAAECTLDLAYGCNALSLAIMMFENERPSFFNEMLTELDRWVPFWKYFVEMNRDTFPSGLRFYYNGDQYRRRLQEYEKPFEWAMPLSSDFSHMMLLGFPMTFRKENTCGILLIPEVADGMNEEELSEVFSENVLTDGETIHRLEARGLAHITGVAAQRKTFFDSYERLTEHSLNGIFGGRLWKQYPLAEMNNVYRLQTENQFTEILGMYEKVDGNETGIASLITQTPKGGKLAVFGFNPWESTVNTARQHQMVSAIDWLCEGKLPVIVRNKTNIVAVPRVDVNGKLRSVTILNASIDYVTDINIELRNPFQNKAFWRLPAENTILDGSYDSRKLILTIPLIEPWGIGIIEL